MRVLKTRPRSGITLAGASLFTAIALVYGMPLGAQIHGSGAVQAPVQPASADRPAVLLDWYAQRDRGDEPAGAGLLADGALFIAAALPGPCSAEPPCFDRAAVLNELISAGGSRTDCYEMSSIELAGSHVTGRIDAGDCAKAHVVNTGFPGGWLDT